jgi:hypothetical protein
MGFTLKGFPELEAALERCAGVWEEVAGSSSAKGNLIIACAPVIKDARGRVKGTGRLRRAIDAYPKMDADSGGLMELGVSYKRHKKAHHAHLVEYGHKTFNQHGGPYRDTKAHPFWAPAVASQGPEALEILVYMTDVALARLYSGK